MKKFITICLLLMATVGFSQNKWNFSVGLMTPIPVDVKQSYRIDMGSTIGKIGYSVSKKMDITLTGGYMRFQGFYGADDFTSVPVMAGAMYHVNNNVHFGAAAGPSYFNKTFPDKYKIICVPYVGYKAGHVSVDINYINWMNMENYFNSMALSVSYTL